MPFTREHWGILSEINSPWAPMLAQVKPGVPMEGPFRKALKSATETEVAEFVFIMSRSPVESKAVLARGRNHFKETAMSYALKFVYPAGIERFASDNASLLLDAIPAVASEPRSNPN